MQHSHQQTHHCAPLGTNSSVDSSLSFFDILSPWTLFPSQFLLSPLFHHFLSLTLSVSLPRSLFLGPSGHSRLDCYICLSAQSAHHGRDCHTEGDRSSCLSWLPVTFVLFLFFVFCCSEVIQASFLKEGRMSTGLHVHMNHIRDLNNKAAGTRKS